MNRFFCTVALLFGILLVEGVLSPSLDSVRNNQASLLQASDAYVYPEFYRGIYLNVYSARSMDRLSGFVNKAKQSNINAIVMDVQTSRYQKCVVPPENVRYCIEQGIHPIARIVVFPEGLKDYPVSRALIEEKLDIAESACLSGFKELQFDYIRFNDSQKLKYLSREERYQFIEGLLEKMKNHVAPYNVKIAADIFGRIPLNRNDIIGQRMEGLDRVVDIICPMAYPSHYTWSKKMQNDPYYTVFITSKSARERVKQAQIVTYIQAFQMRLGDMPYPKYIHEQIRAVHDAGVRGFIFWNARQEYDVPLEVTARYYSRDIIISEKEKKHPDRS
jgi:hypothetical protein